MSMKLRHFALVAGGVLAASCSDGGSDTIHIGYVEADWLYIAAPQSGWVVDQNVAEGDRIAAGDVLFGLDTEAEQAAVAEAAARVAQSGAEARNIDTGAREPEILALQARLAEAEARHAHAIADYERIMPLVEAGLEPRGRGDQLSADMAMAKAAVEALRQDIAVARQAGRPAAQEAANAATASAQAAWDSAQYRLSQRTVVARTSGRVEEVLLDVGEYASPGAPVLAILPDDGLKVRFFVPQAELPQIAIGRAVDVSADGATTPASATVSYIATDAEFTPPVIYSQDVRDKLVFLVEADLPASSTLLPGLPVEVVW